jgi:[acyl-carrier-protein] S-malonyltransferase
MRPAAEKFTLALKDTMIAKPQFPVVSNVDASPASDAGKIRDNLAKQITSSVLWDDSVRYMAAQGVTDFIEIGPGKVLKGLIRRIDKNLNACNIEKPEDIENLPF